MKRQLFHRKAVFIALLCYCWVVRSSDAAPFGASLDRRYDQNTYLAAYNAYANGDLYYPFTANQLPDITTQLDMGVRCLLLDVYYVRQRVKTFLGIPTEMEAEIYLHHGDYLNPTDAFADSPVEVVLAHAPNTSTGGYKLLAGYPLTLTPYPTLLSTLKEIKKWLDSHPDEVVTLILESYVPEPNEIDSCVGNAGLYDMVFQPHLPNWGMLGYDGKRWEVKFHGWPKLSKMVEANKRLVIFSSNGTKWDNYYAGEQLGNIITPDHDGQASQWLFMVENKYAHAGLLDVGAPRAESADLDDMTYPLTFMNWFPDVPEETTVNTLNSYPVLALSKNNFQQAAHRTPNFIALDHVHLGAGGPQLVVTECNRHWARRGLGRTFLTMATTPNRYGWVKRADVQAEAYDDSEQISYYWYGGTPLAPFNVRVGELLDVPLQLHPDTLGGDPYYVSTNDGIFYISAEAVNSTGDRTYRQFLTAYVDETPPMVGPVFITRPPDSVSGWYNHPLTLSVTVRDLMSGAAVAWWTDAHGETIMSDTYTTVPHPQLISHVFEFPYEQEGLAYVQFFSSDYADNISSSGMGFYTNQIRLDMTPPVTSVSVTSMKTGVLLTLSAFDAVSGVAGTWYRLDGGAWNAYTGSFSVLGTAPHTLEFYSRDVAENQEPTRTYYLNHGAVTLTSSQNPSYLYQLLEFTAQVVVDTTGLAPTGTVTFLDGANVMGTATLGTNGFARLANNPTNFALGIHSVMARFDGGGLFGTAFSQSLTQVVARPPDVRLTVSTNRVVETQPLALTAEVVPEGGFTATGMVTFEIDKASTGQLVTKVAVPVDVNGRASYSTTQIRAGSYLIFASYGGDTNVPPAPYGSAVPVTVDPGLMSVSVSSSPAGSSVIGQPVTFTITVTRTPGAPAAVNTGVRLADFDNLLATLSLGSSNSASFTTTSLSVGDHFFVITADSVPQLGGGVTNYQYHVNAAPDVPPYFNTITKTTSGPAGLEIDVQPRRGVLVEFSTNFPNWYPLMTGTNTADLLRVTDFDATNSPARFYRAKLLE
jgi:hypothetical protein